MGVSRFVCTELTVAHDLMRRNKAILGHDVPSQPAGCVNRPRQAPVSVERDTASRAWRTRSDLRKSR